ncbi:MAG: ABC transporter permease [Candidatus Krumholzibacteriia bacterium]
MFRFVLRRTVHAVILVFITLTAAFFILRLAPGDPVHRYYSPDIDPRVMETVRHRLGLDQPLPIQYAKTVRSFLVGDFGVSIHQRRPVSRILAETIPRTLQLTGFALLVQVLLGMGLGMLSATRRGSPLDRTASVASLVFYSLPSFYFAFLLVFLFALKLHWLPAAGMFSVHPQTPPVFADRLRHMILPVTVLAVGSAAALARYARGSLLDVLHEEYIRTARAKGLSERHVVWKHALRNAAPQLLTVVGLSVPFLLTGAVVVEKVFGWPGMGSLMVDAIFARDYPVVLAASFVSAVMVIAGNLLADLGYLWVDPRVRSSRYSPAPGG